MTTYAYCRVSTQGQDLSDQINELKKEGKNFGLKEENIYSEKFTGTTTHRPKFDELMNTVSKGDMIMVTKLDRFARNTKEALNKIDELMDKGVKINVLQVGMLDDTSMGRFFVTVLSAVNELERSFIVERTQSGKEYAKATRKDFKEGRPKKSKNSKVGAINERGATYEDIYNYTKENSVRATAKYYKVAPSTVSRIKKMFKED